MPASSVRNDGASTAPPIFFHGKGERRKTPATRWDASGGIAKNSGLPTDRYKPIEALCYRAMGDDLAQRLLDVSEIHGDFVLSSGARSGVYFDKFRFLTDPALLDELADAVAAMIPDDVTHLASPEGAATLLLAAVGLRTRRPMVVVRKHPKDYGTRSQVEGSVPTGSRVALIEDVSTTGHQTLGAADALRGAGAEIALIVLTVDRGGADALRAEGFEVRTVASL
jgi:orotate phosphoribosyltransferase